MNAQGLLLAAVGLGLALGNLGCKASGGTKGAGGVRTEIDPGASEHAVTWVGILTVANGTQDEGALEIARHVATALAERGYPRFSTLEGFAAEAGRVGRTAEYEMLVKQFRKKAILDPAPLRRLLEGTGHDGILGIEVTDWEERPVDPSIEGTSDTSVGLRLVLYAADGTRLWSGHKLLVEHSMPWDPSAWLATRESPEGAQTVRTEKVPPAPPIANVALEVSRSVVSAIPDLRPRDAAQVAG
jgi:hypothetical protein